MFVEEFWFFGLLNIEEIGLICVCGVGGCGNLFFVGLLCWFLIEFYNNLVKINVEILKIWLICYWKWFKFKYYVIKIKNKKMKNKIKYFLLSVIFSLEEIKIVYIILLVFD